jgi:hypothetical protein
MQKYINSETNQHIMKLIMLGANVQIVTGKTVYVKFKLKGDIEVAYLYNINKNNKYFLERIKPYPLSIKEFETTDDVVKTIQLDYEQFQNAVNSHNIKNFVDINKSLHKTIKQFEDLFLYYNLPANVVDDMREDILNIQKKITQSSTECSRVYFDKEPENL